MAQDMEDVIVSPDLDDDVFGPSGPYGEPDTPTEDTADLVDRICDHSKERIAVEFECGECCKKVLNGRRIRFIGNFLVLIPPKGEFLHLNIFSGGGLVDRQKLRVIFIDKDRVCAVEVVPKKDLLLDVPDAGTPDGI